MTDQQITALAREYAEEIYPHEEDEDIGQMEFLRSSATKHIETALKKLSQRYCLVEKSKAIKAYKAMSDYGKEKGVECAKCANYAARVWMKRLFPEIAKEVEV